MQWKSKSSVRRTLRWVWIYLLYLSGLILWARRRIESSAGIVVLTFHRVLKDEDVSRSDSPPGMVVRRSTFEDLLRFLTSQCDIVSLASVPSWRKGSNRLRVVITFDDGWKDTSDIAFPLTQEWKIPITVFVCPHLTGKRTPFWPEHVVRAWRTAHQDLQEKSSFETVCREVGLDSLDGKVWIENGQLDVLLSRLKRLPAKKLEQVVQDLRDFTRAAQPTAEDGGPDTTMTWEDMSRIASQGAQLGSHTQSHPILTTISTTAVQAELAESKRTLEMSLGRACTLFAYPNGSWSPDVRELVIKEGFSLAFVNSPGVWNSNTDSWLIPRVNLWEGSLLGPSGRFSPAVFQYVTIWRAYRAEIRRQKKARSQAARKSPETARE